MWTKIAGWGLVASIILIGWADIRSDNTNREARRDFAFCQSVKRDLKSEVPYDIAAFCDKVFSDNAARAQAQKDDRIYYLTERAKDVE